MIILNLKKLSRLYKECNVSERKTCNRRETQIHQHKLVGFKKKIPVSKKKINPSLSLESWDLVWHNG